MKPKLVFFREKKEKIEETQAVWAPGNRYDERVAGLPEVVFGDGILDTLQKSPNKRGGGFSKADSSDA
jgi:hypothetical protein